MNWEPLAFIEPLAWPIVLIAIGYLLLLFGSMPASEPAKVRKLGKISLVFTVLGSILGIGFYSLFMFAFGARPWEFLIPVFVGAVVTIPPIIMPIVRLRLLAIIEAAKNKDSEYTSTQSTVDKQPGATTNSDSDAHIEVHHDP